jgi:hypothetical protein
MHNPTYIPPLATFWLHTWSFTQYHPLHKVQMRKKRRTRGPRKWSSSSSQSTWEIQVQPATGNVKKWRCAQSNWVIKISVDMDMSYGSWVSKIWCVSMKVRPHLSTHSHSHKWLHAAAAMQANNVLRNSYSTRPLAMRWHSTLRNTYNTRPLAMRPHNKLCNSFSISLTGQSVTSLTALLNS